MSLTDEQKQFYVDVIDVVWQGSMQNNEVENISDSVADKIEKVLYEIQKCSDQFSILFPIYDFIYAITYPAKWVDEMLGSPHPTTIASWINDLLANRKFKACVVTAAVNWKSSVQMDLNGM